MIFRFIFDAALCRKINMSPFFVKLNYKNTLIFEQKTLVREQLFLILELIIL